MSQIQIVVARYKEDVSWTREFSNVVIYNKGCALDDSYNAIPLSNIGREGHTYYHHIVSNYDHLADHTIFVQGDPFDHCPDFLERLRSVLNNKQIPPFLFFSKCVNETNLIKCKYHAGLPLLQTYKRLFGPKDWIRHCQIFGWGPGKNTYTFGPGAQFLVSRQAIQRRPRNFYQTIVDMLGVSVNPIEGFVIERFHTLIFCIRVPPKPKNKMILFGTAKSSCDQKC